MILSISQQQTTLWDQIVYVGEPSSFAWVLPVKGTVEIGVSSDVLFESLGSWTAVVLLSPTISCSSGGGCVSTGTGGGSFGGEEQTPVTVVSHQVVGPYETVQLSSQDPAALQSWLGSHGYVVPADIAPVVDSYISEGFDFLAMKLIPGVGTDAMRPVRVTTPGANPMLPLRMVAGGTGAKTSLNLLVMAEGRYRPANFPSFLIHESDLVWNWDTSSSNYAELRAAGFAAGAGDSWLIADGEPFPSADFASAVVDYAQTNPVESGYADDMGMGAVAAAQADMEDLFAGIDVGSAWISRLEAELPRPALDKDLALEPDPDQTAVQWYFEITNTTGTPPKCPPTNGGGSCSGDYSTGSYSSSSGSSSSSTEGAGGASPSSSAEGGCAMGTRPAPGALAVLLAWALVVVGVARSRPHRRR